MIKKSLLISVLFFFSCFNSYSLIFYSTGDTNYHTTRPINKLNGGGWDYIGFWGNFIGVPIDSQFFLTSKHINPYVSEKDSFNFNGSYYSVHQYYDDWESDLRLVKIKETFPYFSELYTNINEVGKQSMVFGRGRTRGSEVKLNNSIIGWEPGVYDARLRWGESIISGITPTFGGDCLKILFNPNINPDAVTFSWGDSSGPMFILDETNNKWKLAGINYASDGPYSFSNLGNDIFYGVLFDEKGMHKWDGYGWSPIQTNSSSSAYSVRISYRIPWIKRMIEWFSSDLLLDLLSSDSVNGTYTPNSNVIAIDEVNQVIYVTIPQTTTFYKLNGDKSLRIIGTVKTDKFLLIKYKKAI
jgi:hypothetical protein